MKIKKGYFLLEALIAMTVFFIMISEIFSIMMKNIYLDYENDYIVENINLIQTVKSYEENLSLKTTMVNSTIKNYYIDKNDLNQEEIYDSFLSILRTEKPVTSQYIQLSLINNELNIYNYGEIYGKTAVMETKI